MIVRAGQIYLYAPYVLGHAILFARPIGHSKKRVRKIKVNVHVDGETTRNSHFCSLLPK